MAAPNPMPAELPPPPAMSMETRHMAGLHVDIYGLAELSPSATTVSILWLHHPRLRTREDMGDIARRAVAAWNEGSSHHHHGLLALAFDQRNHGSRLVREEANESWRKGNPTHAQDMFGVVAGTVVDTSLLIDLVEGYLFSSAGSGERKQVVQHLVLGVSLGGHSGWQLMFADPRVTAGVLVIGCPDYMCLISDRARLSKLPSYTADTGGASFLGSADFPRDLVASCRQRDPKAMLFGTSAVPQDFSSPPVFSSSSSSPTRQVLADRIAHKRFLICSGADDKLVPYRCSESFLTWLKKVIGVWPELGVEVEDKLYPGVGHAFSADMVRDAVGFVVDVVAGAVAGAPSEASAAAKI